MEKYLLLIQFLNQTHTLNTPAAFFLTPLAFVFSKNGYLSSFGVCLFNITIFFFDCAITNFWGAAEIFRMMQ